MFKRILVPTDGSDITVKAVDRAIELARLTGASIESVASKDPFPYSAVSEIQPIAPQEFYDAQERISQQRLKAVADACEQAGIPCRTTAVEALHPWEAIVDHAKKTDCDLIVMASHGRRGMGALLLGSETQRVLIHTTLPVLVVR